MPMTRRVWTVRLGWVVASAIVVAPTGCGAQYYIGRIEQQPDRANAWFVHELGKFPHDEQATACLIDQLCRDQPGARYYAAESLKQHLLYCNDALRVRALLQLTKVLDDSRFALVSFPIYGPLLPGGSHFTETSVRIRALATLASSTQKDFGFDQERWRTYIESRAATLSKDK